MPGTEATLVVARLSVYNDVADETFTINLEDLVKMLMDDPHHPDSQRSLIISLLNDEILARHPHMGKAKKDTLAVTIDEFSEIKTQVGRRLLLRTNGARSLPM
jgi:hypothetical protein